MVGVEMWVKVYSPNVQAIEVVKRAEKRARRGKLYYMRYVVAFDSYDPPPFYFPLFRAGWDVGGRMANTDGGYRQPKHDKGSVEREVEEYLKKRRLIRSGALGVGDPSKSAKHPASSRSGVKAR